MSPPLLGDPVPSIWFQGCGGCCLYCSAGDHASTVISEAYPIPYWVVTARISALSLLYGAAYMCGGVEPG